MGSNRFDRQVKSKNRLLKRKIFLNLIVISDCVTRRLLIEDYQSECKLKEIADSITRLHPRNISNGILSKPRNMEPTRDSDITNQKQVYFAMRLFDHLYLYII